MSKRKRCVNLSLGVLVVEKIVAGGFGDSQAEIGFAEETF